MAKIIRVWDGTQWQVVGTALPDALTVDGTQTLTNKSIALGSNTITGTTAQFNTALTDANFATLAGSETLTNKTISGADNTLSNIPNNALTNSSITINGSAISLGGSTTINALPSQTSNSGKYLTTDGSSASWANVTNLVLTDSNISVPGAPTSVTATAGNAQATVSFSVPSDNGGSTILGYTIISNPGNIKKSTTLTTDTITGLTNGTSYTFTVKAHNIAGTSVASSASSPISPTLLSVTGGTLYTGGGYNYRVFTTTGTLAVSGDSLTCDYLVVAGGGSGGQPGSGGGAGGYRTFTSQVLSPNSYTVTVGAGGPAQSYNIGADGNNSSFNSNISTGGGGGGGYEGNGRSGGSGSGAGGRGSSATGTGGAGNTPSTSPSQGNNGGTGTGDLQAGGGGGGAGAVGGNATNNSNTAQGGVGLFTVISGGATTGAGDLQSGNYYFAGGGGGSRNVSSNFSSTGGFGGGGAGQWSASVGGTPISGTANTGGGGGACGGNMAFAGNGGSGIVIVRYAI